MNTKRLIGAGLLVLSGAVLGACAGPPPLPPPFQNTDQQVQLGWSNATHFTDGRVIPDAERADMRTLVLRAKDNDPAWHSLTNVPYAVTNIFTVHPAGVWHWVLQYSNPVTRITSDHSTVLPMTNTLGVPGRPVGPRKKEN